MVKYIIGFLKSANTVKRIRRKNKMIAEILTENLKKATKLPQKRTRYFIKNELKIPKSPWLYYVGRQQQVRVLWQM